MRSVADNLRVETTRDIAQLTPAERIALALRLGDEDLALYRAAHAVSDAVARGALRRARAAGRRPSRSHDVDGL